MLDLTSIPNYSPEKFSDKVVVDRLVEFSQLSMVSKNDVMSLEEFIGMPIVTRNIGLNRFTKDRTSIGMVECADAVNEVIEAVKTNKLEKPITINDVSSAIADCRYELDNIISKLRAIKSIDSDTIARLTNEKYIYSYRDEDNNETTQVRDITSSINIAALLMWKNDYLLAVLDNDTNKFDRLKSRIESNFSDLDIHEMYMEHLPMISMLSNKNCYSVWSGNTLPHTTGRFTVRNFIEMYNNIDALIEDCESTNRLMTYSLDDVKYLFSTPKDMMKTYKQFSGFQSVLKHKASRAVLGVLAAFAK